MVYLIVNSSDITLLIIGHQRLTSSTLLEARLVYYGAQLAILGHLGAW